MSLKFVVGKQKRLKQAKEEAQSEVESYKAEREKQYKELEAKVLGSRGDLERKVEEDTKQKIIEQEQRLADNKAKAIEMLLHAVCEIKPQLHTNYRN